MEAKVNYTIVGLTVVILTAALISVSLWLSVGFDQKQYNTYLVYMNEAVSGLSEQSAVKYNGVQVGYVDKIELDDKNPQRVCLFLAIEAGTPITTSTSATLISQGITGTTYVGLSASTSSLQPLKKHSDELYPVIPSSPSLFNQLDKVLKEVSVNINQVSLEVKKIFDKENARYIKTTLKNLSIVSKELPALTKELRIGVHEISGAGKKVSLTMDSGKIMLDQFSQQTLPPAVSLLHRLNDIAANLEKVSSQMRQNPSVIIRGIKPPKPGPGE